MCLFACLATVSTAEICIFAFQFTASMCVVGCSYFFSFFIYFIFGFGFGFGKNLIVNKNLPCGKFVMQTNGIEMRLPRLWEGHKDKYRKANRFALTQIERIWRCCENICSCSLNNAWNKKIVQLQQQCLIELIGKSQAAAERYGAAAAAGGAAAHSLPPSRCCSCNFVIYIAGFEFTLAGN